MKLCLSDPKHQLAIAATLFFSAGIIAMAFNEINKGGASARQNLQELEQKVAETEQKIEEIRRERNDY